MEKIYIEIDADPWLTCDGDIEVTHWVSADGDIEVNVYFGEACEPNYMSKVSLKELVDRELESMIPGVIPGSDDIKSVTIAEYHIDDTKRLLASLKEAYEYACKRAEELGYE